MSITAIVDADITTNIDAIALRLTNVSKYPKNTYTHDTVLTEAMKTPNAKAALSQALIDILVP